MFLLALVFLLVCKSKNQCFEHVRPYPACLHAVTDAGVARQRPCCLDKSMFVVEVMGQEQ